VKKKFICLAVIAAMVFAFTACGNAPTDPVDESVVEPVETRTVYVTPEWLQSALDGNQEGYENIVVAQVGYEDTSAYDEAHIPGAIYVDSVEVEDAVGDVDEPYNLLSVETIRKNLMEHGITADTKVVLYCSDVSEVARQAYGYIVAGGKDVKIVNGGLTAWKNAGFDTETEANKAEAVTDFGDAEDKTQYWVSMSDAKDKLANDSNFKLVSIRSEDEWLGKTSGYSYMDKAGEPEGAVWGKGPMNPYDMSGYQEEAGTEDGIILTLDDLTADGGLWSDVDFTMDNHLSFYCGTGWRACIPFLICYQAGMDNISVYDGGWYEWMLHDDNPVQVGDPSSEDCQHTTVADLPNDKAAK